MARVRILHATAKRDDELSIGRATVTQRRPLWSSSATRSPAWLGATVPDRLSLAPIAGRSFEAWRATFARTDSRTVALTALPVFAYHATLVRTDRWNVKPPEESVCVCATAVKVD